jgi:hypothetical protein
MSYILPSDAISSAIYLSLYLDTSKDIVVSFDYACYGTDPVGSEGFCVFFANTVSEAIQYGGPGPGLGYSSVSAVNNSTFYGMGAGVLGVGFDIRGNFGSQQYALSGYTTPKQNTITIRDGQGEKYRNLYRTEDLKSTLYNVPFSIYEQITNNQKPTFKRVRVRITDLGNRVLVDMKTSRDASFTNYVDYTFENKFWPTSVRCGLSFATGTTTNTKLKLKNFNVNGVFSSKEGKNDNTYVYLADPATLQGSTFAYTNPNNPVFYPEDIMRIRNANIGGTTNPLLTGTPLIIVDPFDGPQGAPYSPGDQYIGISEEVF